MGALSLFDTEPFLSVDKDPNPCVRMFGLGPEGAHCKTCLLLKKYGAGHSKRWYKCPLREHGGPQTDHRVGWRACARYVSEEF